MCAVIFYNKMLPCILTCTKNRLLISFKFGVWSCYEEHNYSKFFIIIKISIVVEQLWFRKSISLVLKFSSNSKKKKDFSFSGH